MYRAKSKSSLVTRIFEDSCKTASLLNEGETMLHFRIGLESILRESPIKVQKIARCDVETFECVGEFIGGQVANKILKGAECVTDLTRMTDVFDGIE